MTAADADHGRWSVVRSLLSDDLARTVGQISGGAPVSKARRIMLAALPAMQCAILHRLAHLAHRRGHRRLAALLAGASESLTGAIIHPGSRIGPGLMVPHTVRVAFCGTAGRDLMLLPASIVGPDRAILPSQPFPDDAPRLGDGVVVGAHSVALGPIVIGDGAIVGVRVVTRRDIAPGAITVDAPRQRVGPIGPTPSSANPSSGAA